MKSKLRGILLLFFIFIFFVFVLEDFFPFSYIDNVKSQNADVKPPKGLKKIPVLFNIQTEYNGNSLITLKDLTQILNSNIIFLTQNPFYFERKEKNGYIFVKNSEFNCINLYSIQNENSGFLSVVREIKYFLFYSVNKDYAFYQKFKNTKKDTIFKLFNPMTDECFIGSTDAKITIKKVNGFKYPDLKRQINLLKTFIYVPVSFDMETFYHKKQIIKNGMGNSYVSFYFHPNFDFYIVTKDDKVLPIGSSVELSEKPLIYIKKPDGNYIIGVFKNGELVSYYNSSFILKPENSGYYFFIVFKYKSKLFDRFYTSFEPILITNPIFIQ